MLSAVLTLAALGGFNASAPPAGVWQSVGYGLVWSFRSEALQTWEITTATCVPSTLYRAQAPEPGRPVTYRTSDSVGAVANDWIIRASSSAKRLVAHVPGTLNDVEFLPLPALPARCTPPAPGTTAGTFEVFARTMAEHYAFFRERELDWDSVVSGARARLASVPDGPGLYRLLHGMLAPLSDAHTRIVAPDLGLQYPTYRRNDRWMEPDEAARVRDLAPTAYLRDSLERLDGGRLQFGRLGLSIGYLKVTALYGYAATGRFEDDSVAFHRSLRRLLPEIARLEDLVLDLRINAGGYDANAKLLASYLTGRAYPALIKRARSDPKDPERTTRPTRVTVTPAPGPRFTGRLVVLTSLRTVSAGEVLTLMLLSRTPRPVLIGEATQGVFADELVRRLPNGWRFQLSSERYTTPTGASFEGPGIRPDVVVPVFPPGERDGLSDRPLEAALRRLAEREG